MRLTRGDFNEIFLGAWCPHLQNLAGVNRPAAKCIDLGSQSLLVNGFLFNFINIGTVYAPHGNNV